MTMTRRSLLALATGMVAERAAAHHGWDWSTSNLVQISGRIVDARLSKPHWVVTLQSDDYRWQVDVGQPWRNRRIGLGEELLNFGTSLTVQGFRAARPADRAIKALRIEIEGRVFDLNANLS